MLMPNHISNLNPYSISQITVTHMPSEFTILEPIGPILSPTYFTISSTVTISQLLQVSHSERKFSCKGRVAIAENRMQAHKPIPPHV
jgi:hypothetical protein